MFNYDGYINEDYPSFVWLLFPTAIISIAAGLALYFLPAYTDLVFGTVVILTTFFEVWLALGGKRWFLAWGLITLVPLVIALIVAYNDHIYISTISYILTINSLIAVDALYYRRIIPGILHIILASLFIVILIYYGDRYYCMISLYMLVYAIVRLIDYTNIRIILAKR